MESCFFTMSTGGLKSKSKTGTNLWNILPHDEYYYHSGTHWGKHESGTVYSVTIPLEGGDKIFATSFGKYGENGNTIGTGNGIRVTFFDKNGILRTLAPQETHAEFSANGYLTAPEGTVAMNVPMYGNGEENELYILSAEHIYENGICTVCGAWEHPMGDINLDGSVDVKDAYYARLVAAKLIKPTDEQFLVGDADLDGRITALDANIIRKFAAKIITSLPVIQ